MHVTIYPRTRTTFDFMHSTLSRKRQTSNKKSKRGKKYSFSIPRFSAVKNWSNAGRRKIGAKAVASIDRSLRIVSRKASREMTKVEESFKCIITRRLCTVVIPPSRLGQLFPPVTSVCQELVKRERENVPRGNWGSGAAEDPRKTRAEKRRDENHKAFLSPP